MITHVANSSSAVIVRLPREALSRCLGHAAAHYATTGLGGTFDDGHFLRTWEYLYDHTKAAVFGITLGKQDIGGIGYLVAPDQCTPDLVGTMMWVFIDEAHRGGAHALTLFRTAERWAKEQGAVRLRMSYHIKGTPYEEYPMTSPWAGALLSMGYTPLDVLWQKDVQGDTVCQPLSPLS